jgi:hypothetical protein
MTDPKPEPGTVAPENVSTNFFWRADGFKFQTTVRGNPTRAQIEASLKSVLEAVDHILTDAVGGTPDSFEAQKAATTSAPKPLPAHPSAPPVDGEFETMQVTAVKVEFNTDGTKKLNACGGKWAKFGVRVWPEVAALKPDLADWNNWDPGEYQYAAQANVLLKEGKPQKVVGWK